MISLRIGRLVHIFAFVRLESFYIVLSVKYRLLFMAMMLWCRWCAQLASL